MLTIKAQNSEYRVSDHKGKLLSDVISAIGIPLDLRCSGKGICGRCLVVLEKGKYSNHEGIINVAPGASVEVKSCRCTSLGDDGVISVPESAIASRDGRIDEHFKRASEAFLPAIHILTLELPDQDLEGPVTESDLLSKLVCDKLELARVSCNIKVLRDLPATLKNSRKIDVCVIAGDDGEWSVVRIGDAGSLHKVRAAAVDVGTTTVAAVLINPFNGDILCRASAYNQQMRNGDNVASRISFAAESIENLRTMQQLVMVETIDPLLCELCEKSGTDADDIIFAALAGNTVMNHLALGINPESIGSLPFSPVTNVYPACLASDIGLLAAPDAVIQCVPSISGYIGGDLTAGIAVSELDFSEGVSALIDIGTNSETVLNDNGRLYSCAAAAGPAFEGAGVSCGMRAADGAIEGVKINDELDFQIEVIGNCKPEGLCGSAMVDFIAEGFKSGLINSFGRYDLEQLRACGRYLEIELNGNPVHACVLSGNKEDMVYISESDIEQILKAKAAVYAGLKTLLAVCGKQFADLDRIFLAGGFARYIDIENAVTIGMLPKNAVEIVEKIGNSSLAGAYRRVTDCNAAARFMDVITKPRNIALNTVPEFEMNYIEALAVPNFNPDDFPNISVG